MAWVRLDDHFDEHDKWLDAGPEAGWLMIRALAYCNRKESDGHIKPAALANIGSDYGPAKRKRLVARLVEVVLLHVPGHGCVRCPQPIDGWQVHDYADYQPTRAKLEADREQRREAGRKGGLAKGKRAAKRTASESLSEPSSGTQARPLAKSKPGPVPVPGASNEAPPVPPDGGDINAGHLMAEHLEAFRSRPPSRVIGHTSREVKALLDEGIDVAHVRAGLAALRIKALHPSALASLVSEAMNPPAGKTRHLGPVRPPEGDVDYQAGWNAGGAS